MKRVWLACALAVTAAAAACTQAGAPAPPFDDPPELYTVASVLEEMEDEPDGDAGGIPYNFVAVPPGDPISTRALFETPAPVAPANEGAPTLPVHIAFADGEPAAYAITEVWYDFDEVWVQPLYFPVKGFNPDGSPQPAGLKNIFSIDEHSRFYSPFWVVRFFVVPEGTAGDHFRTAKDVLDYLGKPLSGAGTATDPFVYPESRTGPGAICSIVPIGTKVDSVRPLFDAPNNAVAVAAGNAWVEGREVGFVSFGLNRFRWNDAQVVIEDPIYIFAGADGKPLGLPNVAASEGIPAPGGKPQSALWRLTMVRPPASARPFIPDDTAGTALRAKFADRFPDLGAVDAAVAARTDLKNFTLRLAQNPKCWKSGEADAANFPASCKFLDSESALKASLAPTAFTRTETTATCPLIYWKNAPVP